MHRLVTPLFVGMSLYPLLLLFFLNLFLPFSEEALRVRENVWQELESSTQCSCVVKLTKKLPGRTR